MLFWFRKVEEKAGRLPDFSLFGNVRNAMSARDPCNFDRPPPGSLMHEAVVRWIFALLFDVGCQGCFGAGVQADRHTAFATFSQLWSLPPPTA